MVKGFKILLMDVSMKDSMSMESQKGLEGIPGLMDNFIKDNGLME